MSFHTAIVGAGPAGAAAAHRLASAGASVVLIDKATFPRDKFCGDGLTTLALRQLDEMGFDPSGIPSWTAVDGAVLRSPDGRRIDLPLPANGGLFAAVARREELDAALVEFASDAGATLELGQAVTQIQHDDDGVELELADGRTLTARQVLGADGMWSPTRKMLGMQVPKYRGEWHGFRQYFSNVSEAAANELWVWFEPDLLPGYLWSFPVGDGRANVGFGILRGGDVSTQDMKRLWPDLLSRPHVVDVLGSEAVPEAPHKAWPIPARIDKAPLVGPRSLFVGDAAMACDVLTGEGIGQALLTGRLAANAILEGGSFETIAERYEHAVRCELVADHRMATALGKLLSSSRVTAGALRAVDLTEWTRRNFARWMFEDYPRAVLATPRRWQKGIFHQPGAFSESVQS